MKLKPTFNFSLNSRVADRCAALAKLDSASAKESIVVLSTSNKALIQGVESPLHVADTVRALAVLPLPAGHDALVVGTARSVVVYDPEKNVTLFQKDIPDGVSSFAIGKFAGMDQVILCGGNCAIWGFDVAGEDVYWTVTGDKVNALCLCDIDKDGEQELIVGSDDYEMRIFKNDLMREEIVEVDKVTHLLALTQGRFGYALNNGSVGVYEGSFRLWRSKCRVNLAAFFSFPNDDYICCVWDGGKVDIRSVSNGDVLAKEMLSAAVATAFPSRGTSDDSRQMTVVFVDGRVRGLEIEQATDTTDDTERQLREFGQRKHNLLVELNNFEQEEQLPAEQKDPFMRIPANTEVASEIWPNMEKRILELSFAASNDLPIKGCVALAEGIFDGESHVCMQSDPTSSLNMPIRPLRDQNVEMHIQVFVGHLQSNHVHIFPISHVLPRFARYVPVEEKDLAVTRPTSYVEWSSDFRPVHMTDWVRAHFTCQAGWMPTWGAQSASLTQMFVQLQPLPPGLLVLSLSEEGMIRVEVDTLETAAAMVQSLAEYGSVDSLSSRVVFPAEMEKLTTLTDELEQQYEVRDKLNADLSEKHTLLKELLVRGEDAIAIDEPVLCRKYYTRLRNVERSVRQAHLLLSTNHERLVKTLRTMHKQIELAAKCRVGPPSRNIVSACRQAIANANLGVITKILEFGSIQ